MNRYIYLLTDKYTYEQTHISINTCVRTIAIIHDDTSEF